MKSIFICYPKCSTCQKARKFLEEKGIEFEERHIVEQNPKQDELKRWIAQSGLPIKRFFNTSGLKYKALQLKDKLPNMTETEQIELLATDGMLVKRPLLNYTRSHLGGLQTGGMGNLSMIQIFGKAKCFDTKKAIRYFKERKIPVQYIDIKQKPMSKG